MASAFREQDEDEDEEDEDEEDNDDDDSDGPPDLMYDDMVEGEKKKKKPLKVFFLNQSNGIFESTPDPAPASRPDPEEFMNIFMEWQRQGCRSTKRRGFL